MESSKITWVKVPKKLVITFEGHDPINLQSDTQQYKTALRYIRANKKENLINYLFPVKRVEAFSNNKFTLRETQGNVEVVSKADNSIMPQALAKKLLEFAENSFSIRAYMKFWENLQKNPNKDSVDQLFLFLERYKYPITSDGCFLAYKYVTSRQGHLYDSHSGKFLNDVGCVVAMNRNDCDSAHDHECSSGLHVAAFQYATKFGGDSSVLIVVKVNPKDVVAVPKDYSFKKMRVCRYEVIAKGEKAIIASKYNVEEGKSVEEKCEQKEIDKGYVTNKELGEMKYGIDGLTAQQIIDKAKTDFNEVIDISVKNKKAIMKKFILIASAKSVEKPESFEKPKLNFEHKTAQEIVEEVFKQTGEKITTSLKNKKTILKKAEKILTKHGFEIIR